MANKPGSSIYSIVEKAYFRLQAGDVLTHCIEDGSSNPIHEMIQDMVLAGPQSLEAVREILGEASKRKSQVYDDLNQVTNDTDVQLQVLKIVIDFTPSFGDARDNPPANDIPSSLQNDTRAGFGGGTVASYLASDVTVPLNVQGAGWADYIIDTKVDPFDPAYQGSTRILFHWESAGHTDGGETIFLSGTYAVPEPATLALLAMSGPLLIRRRRLRYASD